MSEIFLLLIPLFPLLSAILTPILGPRVLREKVHYLTIAAFASSFLCSILLFSTFRSQLPADSSGFEITTTIWQWVNIADAFDAGESQNGNLVPFQIDVTLRADALTILMQCMVTFISTLVAIFGAGYMKGDGGYWRFFSYVSLFVFSMTMLVSVSNFLLLFVFWEAVGVCSYLLIGFWYEKKEASIAGMKAFLVNRVGDFGFALAIFLIWITYGTLNFHDILASDGTIAIHGIFGHDRLVGALPYQTGGIATAICLLLFVGACGKSAQFPLHIWLPDAMEGPTPVSALIHAATMVTAGVYMVVRCTPLFMASPDAQIVVASIGGITALLAGLIALTQHDLKRVLAYSTISQLGYMFLALGTGSLAGIYAGMFHLFTHAFFKALLFLGSGSVMHAMGNIIDMRRFSGLRKLMPWTCRTFLCGCLALAGVFPFAGFFSKDAIIASVHDKAHASHTAHAENSTEANRFTLVSTEGTTIESHSRNDYAHIYNWLFRLSVVTAFLTAFYTFRAFFMTFFGDLKVPESAGHHAHESPPMMLVPLLVLAAFAFCIGWFDCFGFLETTPSLAYGAVQDTLRPGEFHYDIAALSTFVALSGIGLAAYFYLGSRREIESISRFRFGLFNVAHLHALSYYKFFVDELYHVSIVLPLRAFAKLNFAIDRFFVDGLVNSVARIALIAGSIVRRFHGGLVPFYGMIMLVGTFILLFLSQLLWGGK